MTIDARTTRQARLVEVGEAGQARLASARVSVGAGEAVLDRYLRGAGLEAVLAPSPPTEEVPAWVASLSPAARDVAAGAHAALVVVRAVLAGAPHPRLRGHEPRA